MSVRGFKSRQPTGCAKRKKWDIRTNKSSRRSRFPISRKGRIGTGHGKRSGKGGFPCQTKKKSVGGLHQSHLKHGGERLAAKKRNVHADVNLVGRKSGPRPPDLPFWDTLKQRGWGEREASQGKDIDIWQRKDAYNASQLDCAVEVATPSG